MVDTAAILAGGLATRLHPITEQIPKSLVDVAGKPFIDRQLSLLRARGIRRVVLCLAYLGEQIETLVGTGDRWDLSIEYSYDGPVPVGTAGALRQAAELLGDCFWVLYGDSYLDFDYSKAARYFLAQGGGKLGLMAVFENQNKWDTSNILFRGGRLVTYDKWHQTPDMRHIDYGATLLRPHALDLIPNQPYDLADLYKQLVEQGLLLGYEVDQRFYEVGSPAGLEEARTYFSRLEAKAENPINEVNSTCKISKPSKTI